MVRLERIKLVSDHTDENTQGEALADLLQRNDMVDAIAGAILGVAPPFTFGIYGSWGSGKTYFMKLVRDRIEKDREDAEPGEPEPIIVEFEAWRHAKDERPDLSLVLSAYNELDAVDRFRTANDREAWKQRAKGALATLLTSLPEVKLGIPMAAEITLAPGDFFNSLLEQHEQAGEVKLSEKQEQVELQKKFKDVLDALSEYNGDEHRIVFLIDDLDRCSSEDIVGMLEKIKLFLWHPRCVFVLGADESAVQDAIKEIRGKGNEEKAEKYLEKIVNYPFRLPPVSKETNNEFLRNKLGAEETSVIAIFNGACDDARASLRMMVQLSNTYKISKHLAKKIIDPTAEEYEPEIMAVLVALQVLYPREFDKLCGGAAGREDRLKAFFSSEGEESNVPIALKTAAVEINTRDVTYSHYVEFLVSQGKSSAKSAQRTVWEWYEKDVLDSEDIGSVQDAIAAIRNGSKEVTIDGYIWQVLTVDGDKGRTLLITKNIIGNGPIDVPHSFNDYQFDWQTCDLKKRLNSIEWLTEYLPELSQDRRIDEGQDGKLFLLSIEEADEYFSDKNSRIARRIDNGVDHRWWLRSPGSNTDYAAIVYGHGGVSMYGNGVSRDFGIRPSLWLNLESQSL
ncbi:MAG: KAP family NTPase [Coriobacteriales bacterium]|jgi:hypothetical protein|nr:KAP family NTPase [Coriobacteriales bacterium]